MADAAAIESTLWVVEEEFWLAGADVYRRRLADDALMVFAGMILTKPQAVESISHAPRWTSVRFRERRTVWLAPDAVALVYRASGTRDAEEPVYSATITSVYTKPDDEWKLTLHQQSADTTASE